MVVGGGGGFASGSGKQLQAMLMEGSVADAGSCHFQFLFHYCIQGRTSAVLTMIVLLVQLPKKVGSEAPKYSHGNLHRF